MDKTNLIDMNVMLTLQIMMLISECIFGTSLLKGKFGTELLN